MGIFNDVTIFSMEENNEVVYKLGTSTLTPKGVLVIMYNSDGSLFTIEEVDYEL